jgi:Bacterial Ig domain/FG-GAP-like repeat/Glucodextranase, domain B/Immunoglobulin domain
LIATCYYVNELAPLTNNSEGIYSWARLESLPPAGAGIYYITNADFNKDGLQDVVTVNNYSSTITVLTNGGNFTFSNSATLTVPDAPVWVAVADVNSDGKPDLISANYGDCGNGNTLTVFINLGQGNFATNATLTVGYGPVCVVAVDVNGDGFVDLVSANQDNTVTVLTNDGLGNFTLKSSFPVFSPTSMVAADLTGSGKMDLAIANGNYYTDGTVTIFLNDGAGNFTSNTTVSVGYEHETNNPSNIQAADVNGDGLVDLIVANYASSSVSILTQTTVRPPPPVITITSPTNGGSFSTNTSFTIVATVKQTGTGVNQVEFLRDGSLLGISTGPPFSLQVPAGSIPPGGHNLQAVAVNSGGINATSAVVQITLDVPGTALIDFDALNTSQGAVGGTVLANYLAQYGVTLANVTFGTEMEAVDTNSFTGGIEVRAPSSPNIFTQAGLNQPVSFTLRFATNLQAFGFTRAGLLPLSGLVSHPKWTATAFDSNGTELSSVTEGLIVSPTIVPKQAFVLTGNGIASVRFDSDSQQTAAFSAVLLDNLLLDYNAVTPAVAVALSVASPATNDIVAPATITLSANVTDQLSSTFTVFFYAGPTLLGSVSSSPFSGGPYQFTVNNVLPGNYALQARVVDLSSDISALSPIVPITVQLEPNSTLIDFDTLNTSRAPEETAAVESYLSGYGVTVASLSPGTELTVDRQQHIAGGSAVLAPSPPNLLTQTGSNGPVQFTLRFAPTLSQFGFTRPELLANPFVSHPAWQATAFDGSGAVVGQVGEAEIDSSTNVGAREFSLETSGGPGIAEVQFASQGSGLTTFNAMLVDNLILTTNTAAFPPAVAITSPISGVTLARPPAVTVAAAASDPTGIASVTFYANGFLLGTDTAAPYTFHWVRPSLGNYQLTAVASNNVGLAWTSPIVNITIQPSASIFLIESSPASQTVAAGGSATFAVVATGTNHVTYQWYYNNINNPISGATSPTLILPPPITDANAGTYFVNVTAPGPTTLTSDSAILTVVDAPIITSQPEGQTVEPGSNVILDVAVASAGPVTYQWLLNGNSIPGATDSTYSIDAAQPRQSGNYQVAVANQAASTLSVLAPVIVETAITIPETNTNFQDRASFNPLLGPISDSNDLATVQRGAPLPDGVPGGNSIWFTWTPTFTGTATLTTQGSDFDTVMAVYTGTVVSSLRAVAADDDSGGYLTSLVTFNVTAGTAYQIAVDGHQGASGRVVLGFPAGTGYRILNPTSGDSVPVIVRNPASQTVAPGAPAELSVVATSATKITYQWYFQGVPIPGATASTLAIAHVQPGSVGMYDVLVANAAGSSQSELATIQIGANLGGKVSSTGSKFGTSTTTASPAELAMVLRPFSSGGDSAGFSVSQVFSTTGATTQPGEPQPCGQVGSGSEWFSYTAPANGIMQINTDGSTFNTILGVYTGPGTSFASLDEVGCGYSTNYTEQGQPSVILTNVTRGTTFFILVQGYQGSAGVAKLQIGLGQPLAFRDLPASQLVTAGNNATFAATAIGSTPVSYQWQLNGANLAGATKSTFTVTAAQNESVGNYAVIASNPLGAVTSSPPAALTVQFAPAVVAGPSNETVTLGLPARFSVEALGVNVKTNPFVCQWYFNGAPIPKATGLSLLLPVTHWTNQGAYYLVISNSYGSATSGSATLTLIDKIPPTVAITSPANNSETNIAGITVTGTAADKVGIAQVQVEVNSAGFFAANGQSSWNAPITLTPGANVISAYSTDLAGNSSVVVKHTITYNSSAMKRDTQTKTATRSPLNLSGTYSGLFYPAAGASRANSGFFTATIASGASGAFTANILLDSQSYPFTGKFDSTGMADSLVLRAGKSPVTASLRLDPDSPSGQMTGSINGADWRSVLRAGLTVFGAAAHPAPVDAGQFALVVPSGAVAPAGYLAITNTAGGAALVTGTLPDGESIFRIAPKGEGPAIPFYTPLYSGQGLFLAWISFTNSAPQANLGPAIWIGPGFTNLTDIIIVK